MLLRRKKKQRLLYHQNQVAKRNYWQKLGIYSKDNIKKQQAECSACCFCFACSTLHVYAFIGLKFSKALRTKF